MKTKLIVTPYTPRGRKGGWYVTYQPDVTRTEVLVFRTKAQATKVAKNVSDYQGIVGVYWIWPEPADLKSAIGPGRTIRDLR